MGSTYAPALMDSMKHLSYTEFYATVASGKKEVSVVAKSGHAGAR